MGKPTGFMEYQRNLGEERAPLERIHDWNEFHLPLTVADMQQQGARCMDCGIPFCHTGILLNGMASGCPINNLIPEWNDLVYMDQWEEALARLHKTNNFPEFTGRVCPAPCEGSCTLGINEPAVTIKSIECAIVDRGFEEGWVTPDAAEISTGKRVAVVGSGPSGLACAAQLNSVGHRVTVYERSDRVGGLLMYGIPNMKLDKNIVQRRVNLMEREGVVFITNCEVGKDVTAQQLQADYDAIVLCCGATKPRDLTVEGRELKGVHYAMEYLHGNTKHLLDMAEGSKDPNAFAKINAEGKDVIVIGGGDTGNDCLGTAMRQGCRSLNMFEILPQPPMKRASDNPWPEWPKVLRTDYGHAEAAARFGEDPRTFLISTKKFVGDENGKLKELHTVMIEWDRDEDTGRFTLKEVPGTERVWPAQLVLLALGFLGPEDSLVEQFGLERDARSNVKAEHEQYHTSIEGVFAAGDMRRGQSLVVWAINEGRGAARECDRWLMGETSLP